MPIIRVPDSVRKLASKVASKAADIIVDGPFNPKSVMGRAAGLDREGDLSKVNNRESELATIRAGQKNGAYKKIGADEAKRANPSSYSKGGLVRKSGIAKVHAGERVLTKSQTKKYHPSKGARKRA